MLGWIKRLWIGVTIDDVHISESVRPSFTVRYALAGALFGATFPIVAMTILSLIKVQPINIGAWLLFQQTEPLLWTIDTAPLVLGFLASIAGRREDQLRLTYRHLKQAKVDVSDLRELTLRLERRTNQLATLPLIAQRFSVALGLEQLLQDLLAQLQLDFHYYHAHVYLVDDKGETLVVAEGTGEAGAAMKANRHSIALDAETSLVARAARTGEVIWVDNVRNAKDWLPNPLLPGTYSELAVPILLGDELIGVLDVQEDRVAGFDEGDANMLKLLANQIAVAVRNVRLFVEVESALADARQLQQRYQTRAWSRERVVRRHRGQAQFNPHNRTPLATSTIATVRKQALQQMEPAIINLNNIEATVGPASQSIGANDAAATDAGTAQAPPDPRPTVAQNVLVAPITVNNVTIGDLQLYGRDTQRHWTEDEISFVEAVIDQVAQAAENLRLFEETQERASRERLIVEIGEKMRRAPNMESLMKITTAELVRVLGSARAFVQLGSPSQLANHVSPAEKNGRSGESATNGQTGA